jgi:hypothetical protein
MEEIRQVLNNLHEHIIYDKNLNSICFSAEFIKVKQEILKMLDQDKRIEKLKSEGYIEFERYEIGGNMSFKIIIDKLQKGQMQLGLFLNREVHFVENITYNTYSKETERYLYICLFKITIAIGFMW